MVRKFKWLLWSALMWPAVSVYADAGMHAVFAAAWERQPEARALADRRAANEARRVATESLTPEGPSLELSATLTRPGLSPRSDGLEAKIAAPLWLRGEQAGTVAVVDAQSAALEARAAVARWRLAGELRERYWRVRRAQSDLAVAKAKRDAASALLADTEKRLNAGDLAPIDHVQAQAALAEARASESEALAEVAAARALWEEVAGARAPMPSAFSEPPSVDQARALDAHVALAELRSKLLVLQRESSLTRLQRNVNPEIALAVTREPKPFFDPRAQALTLSIKFPLGTQAAYPSKVAHAQAEITEAEAALALETARLRIGIEAARARLESLSRQRELSEEMVRLSASALFMISRAHTMGESDLPALLRLKAEANAAVQRAARGRIEQAAALSALRQSAGLLFD